MNTAMKFVVFFLFACGCMVGSAYSSDVVVQKENEITSSLDLTNKVFVFTGIIPLEWGPDRDSATFTTEIVTDHKIDPDKLSVIVSISGINAQSEIVRNRKGKILNSITGGRFLIVNSEARVINGSTIEISAQANISGTKDVKLVEVNFMVIGRKI